MCLTKHHSRGFCEIDWELRMFSDAVFWGGAEEPSFLGDRADLFKSSKVVFKVNWQNNKYVDLYTRAFMGTVPPPLVPLSCASFHFFDCSSGWGVTSGKTPNHLKDLNLNVNDGSVNMPCFRRRGAHSSVEARPWLVKRRSSVTGAKKKRSFSTVCIISASALKEQGSSKCRQNSRKGFLCLQLLAAVTLVGDERCIRHSAGRWNKAIQRVAWKASQARARAQEAPLWWPGKELSPLTWCWRFKYTLG